MTGGSLGDVGLGNHRSRTDLPLVGPYIWRFIRPLLVHSALLI